METQKLNKRSIIGKWIYRFLTSAIAIFSFAFFKVIGFDYLETGLYSGWIGLGGAIGTIIIIRILFGSYKMSSISNAPIPEVTDINSSASVYKPDLNPFQPEYASELPLPRFGHVIQPDINRATVVSEPQPSVENNLQHDLDIVKLKEEKLDKMKTFIDKMDPRLFSTLKRRYSLEKQIIGEDIKTAEKNLTISIIKPKFVFDGPSVMEPTIIESNIPFNSTNQQMSQDSTNTQDDNDSNYENLLQRFMNLDDLLSTRLKLMKVKKSSVISSQNGEIEKTDNSTIETTV